MRSFERDLALVSGVPAPVARTLADLDRGRGRERGHRMTTPEWLVQLAVRSRVESIKTSSALEGVVVPDDRRADRIIGGTQTSLRTRNEQELAGYRDALDYIWTQDWHPLNTGLVLHLHRLLLGHTATPGGAFKTEDNVVIDRASTGSRTVRFTPVSARLAPDFTRELVARYVAEHRVDVHHPIILVGLFILDFLVIHPFEDGNGRVARVLTNALLADCGYGVGRYVSLEALVAETESDYYASLLASTHHWHDGEHDPWPWIGYLARQVGRAYELLEARARSAEAGQGKRDRVKDFVRRTAPARFRIADVRAALPGISDGTIRNALNDLRLAGLVEVDGPGRSATWRRLS